MARRVVSLRLDGELLDWLTAYAARRGVSRTACFDRALQSFREDAGRGVPNLGAGPAGPVQKGRPRAQGTSRSSVMADRQRRLNRDLGR